MSPNLELLDYFTPYNSATLNTGDMDLGSAGLLLIPNISYVLGGGKQGVLYLSDSNGMGKFNSSTDQVRQEFQAVYGNGASHIHGSPVYFDSDQNGPTTYLWGENDVLRGFLFNSTTGLLNTTPFATSTMTAPVTNNDGAMPGGFLSISANGNSNGILWASTPYDANAVVQTVQGVLYAFNAETYNSGVTLTATVASSAGTPTGTVTFYNGSTALGTGTLNGSGVATLSTATLPVGTDNLTATYAAGGNFSGSTSPASSISVTQASQTITFPTVANRAYGSRPFAVTATSSAGSGYPVTITVQSGPAVISGGTVSLSGVGTIVLQAAQAGDKNYSAATATQSFQVTPAPLTVSANNASRAYGAANPVFSGTVTGSVGSDSFTESFTTTATTSSNAGSYPIARSAIQLHRHHP